MRIFCKWYKLRLEISVPSQIPVQPLLINDEASLQGQLNTANMLMQQPYSKVCQQELSSEFLGSSQSQLRNKDLDGIVLPSHQEESFPILSYLAGHVNSKSKVFWTCFITWGMKPLDASTVEGTGVASMANESVWYVNAATSRSVVMIGFYNRLFIVSCIGPFRVLTSQHWREEDVDLISLP